MKMKYLLILCVFFLSSGIGNTQTTGNGILSAVYSKLQKAKDYTVQAKIKVDIPLIKILPVEVKIYYKQKGKFKVESKGIAIVPRQGFDMLAKMLADSNSFTTVIQGDEKINNTESTIVNLIPLSDTSDFVFAKFWVDKQQKVILKSQVTTKTNGTVLTEYTYGSQVQFGLPDQMIFSVDIKKFKIPKKFTADMNKTNVPKDEKGKETKEKKGKIYITLTNYQVNKGIPDSFFVNQTFN